MKECVKQLMLALVLLTMTELCAYAWLAPNGRAFFPVFNLHKMGELSIETLHSYGFDEIDPLLGWGMSETRLRDHGFELRNGMPVLHSQSPVCNDTLRILVTGGSTTDVAMQADNWPMYLVQELSRKGICATVHMGAVGGYASGQELLRLIRDGHDLMPDIHISYSGANETSHPSLVSEYEMELFGKMMFEKTSFLFPNIVFILREKFMPRPSASLHPHPSAPPQWTYHMDIMNAIAIGRGYVFIGVLQPVLGIGKIVQPDQEDRYRGFVEQYRDFYPTALADVQNRPYLVNMTALFDTVPGPVFLDDCHLRPEAQPIVAKAILNLILTRRPNKVDARTEDF